MKTTDYVSQFEYNKFKVRSQTNPEKFHIVSKTENGLICECKDHEVRKAYFKHIKIVLEIIMKNRCYKNNIFRIMERSALNLCKYCDSGRITKKRMGKPSQAIPDFQVSCLQKEIFNKLWI